MVLRLLDVFVVYSKSILISNSWGTCYLIILPKTIHFFGIIDVHVILSTQILCFICATLVISLLLYRESCCICKEI